MTATPFIALRPPEPAQELRDLLTILGWKNGRLAEHVGVTQTTVSRWLHRKTRVPGLVLRELRSRVKLSKRRQADG